MKALWIKVATKFDELPGKYKALFWNFLNAVCSLAVIGLGNLKPDNAWLGLVIGSAITLLGYLAVDFSSEAGK